MQYSFQLKQRNEEDYKQSVIEKGGITADFTIAEIEAMQERNKKALKETEGQLEIKQAEIVNIDHFHPTIKDMTGEELTAAWIYKEATDYVNKSGAVIDNLKAAIAENDATIAEAMKVAGFEETDFPAPVEPTV